MNSIIETALKQAGYRGMQHYQRAVDQMEVTDVDLQCWFIALGGVPECPQERLDTLIPLHNQLSERGQIVAAMKVSKAIDQETARAAIKIAAE